MMKTLSFPWTGLLIPTPLPSNADRTLEAFCRDCTRTTGNNFGNSDQPSRIRFFPRPPKRRLTASGANRMKIYEIILRSPRGLGMGSKREFLGSRFCLMVAPLGTAAAVLLVGHQEALAGGVQTLETVEVVDSANDLVGVADTATVGTVLKEQINSRPVYREGELLENVPGLIVTQHSGEGKADQYYLRGFNLDHGTDIAISLDDMPVNMRTHAHGQGYSDINFMIPELLSGMKYEKGPYFADQGDFATAGAVQMNYLDKLDKDWAEVGGGSFGYARGFTAISRPVGQGTLLAAVEAQHLDGPWSASGRLS